MAKMLYWDGAALQTIEASIGGKMRYLRTLRQVALHEHVRVTTAVNPTTNLRIYDSTTRAYLRTITVPTDLQVQTLRVFGGLIAVLYGQGPTMRARLWDFNWNQIADYEVSETKPGLTGGQSSRIVPLTVWRPTPGSNVNEYAIGNVGSRHFILAKWYAGVVPYADLEGKSVAAGLREIALMTVSYVNVDVNSIGTVRQRSYLSSAKRRRLPDIGRPLSRISRLLWEFYRTSVKVTGRTESGTAIEVITGKTGDSAKRLDLDGAWITTRALATAIGDAHSEFLSVQRGQEDVTIAESDEPIHVLQNVRMANRSYLAVSCTNDTKARQFDLRLVEVG